MSCDELRPMNGNLKHSKTRKWQAGYQQGHPKDVYPFVLTNWVRDKADPRKEDIKLTHLDGHDKEHVGQVATRWVHRNQPVLTFGNFKDLVAETLRGDDEGLYAAERCLEDVERLYSKKFARGNFIEAVTRQYPEEGSPSSESENVVTARFVCFPLFALYPQDTTNDSNMHPPRAMAQYFYQLEDTHERDARQTIRKLNEKEDPECDILHVFHLWAMTINNTTITTAPLSTKALLGHNLTLVKHDESYERMGPSIRYTDRNKKQYFFPLKECKQWNHLIKKIGDVVGNANAAEADAEIILNPHSEYRLVDEHHLVVDEVKWNKIANVQSLTKLIILQLVVKASARYDGESDEESDRSSLAPDEQNKMYQNAIAKWTLLHWESLERKLNSAADEATAEHLRARVDSARDAFETVTARRRNIISRFRLGAERYRALPESNAQASSATDSSVFENVADDVVSVLERPTSQLAGGDRAFLQDLAQLLHEFRFAGQGPTWHEGYYPRSNCPVSSMKPYRSLPGSQQMSGRGYMEANAPIAASLSDPSSQHPLSKNPFTLRSVGSRHERDYYHHYDRRGHSPDDRGTVITQRTPSATRSLRTNSAPQGVHGLGVTPLSASSFNHSTLHEEAPSSSPISTERFGDHTSRPSLSRPALHNNNPDANPGRRRKTAKHNHSSKSADTPILEWPVDDAGGRLQIILGELHRKLQLPFRYHEVEQKDNTAYRDIQASNREECVRLIETLEDSNNARKPKGAMTKRSLVTIAGDLLDSYVPDHFRTDLVDKYWGAIYLFCEMSPERRLVEDITGREPAPPYRSPAIITFVQDTSWEVHKRIERILKRVRSTSTGRTLPYRLPQTLIDSFYYLMEFYLISTFSKSKRLLKEAAKRIFDQLGQAEHNLPHMFDETEDNIFNYIGYQHVDAHALLALILENCLKISSHDLKAGREHESACFDIVNLYRQYVTGIRFKARDAANLKVYEDIKLVSEELSIIKSVLEIQWEVAAAFEVMTSTKPTILERRVKSRIFEHLTQTMENFDELIDRVRDARIDATQSIEVRTDLNNKAILIFTTVSTIFLPLTFISGLLSMNTKDISNLKQGQWLFWAIAIPLTIGIMISAVCFAYFGSLMPTARRTLRKISRKEITFEGLNNGI